MVCLATDGSRIGKRNVSCFFFLAPNNQGFWGPPQVAVVLAAAVATGSGGGGSATCSGGGNARGSLALAKCIGETHYPSERTADHHHELIWLALMLSDADHHLFG